MQKRFLTLMMVASAAIVFFSSCSKSNKQGRYIPSDAAVVLHIDGESLNEKLPWEEVKQNELFKKASADTSIPAFAKSVMDNPENSGVDIKNDFEIFVMKEAVGGYVAIEGALKDEAKFKKFLTDANKNAKETSKDGYTYLNDGRTNIGFNKEKFIITVDAPEMSNMNGRNKMNFPTDTAFGMVEVPKTRDMMPVTANLFNLKEDASLAKNEKFTDLIKTKGDAHVWYNAEMLLKGMDMGPMGAMANMNKLTAGMIFTGTVSFDNGKINFDGKSYLSKDMEDIYKKYGTDAFDKTMVKNIPSQNLAGMMIMNFKPEGLKEILKVLGIDGLANVGLAQTQAGITLDDIAKAGKGDFLFALTDISKDTGMFNSTTAEYYFAASVGDKAAFTKVMDAGKKMMLRGEDSMAASVPLPYNMNDKYFVFAKSKESADKYLSGTANTSFSFLDNISGGSFGGYVNFQYILNSMKPSAGTDSLALAGFDASLKMWDNLIIKGGELKGGAVTQHWEVNLVDKNTNSLKQLNKYAASMGLIAEAHKKEREKMWNNMSDTATVIMPPMPSK